MVTKNITRALICQRCDKTITNKGTWKFCKTCLEEERPCLCGCGTIVIAGYNNTKIALGHFPNTLSNNERSRIGIKARQVQIKNPKLLIKPFICEKCGTVEEGDVRRKFCSKCNNKVFIKICACPNHEEFTTKNPKVRYINGHGTKGVQGRELSQSTKEKLSKSQILSWKEGRRDPNNLYDVDSKWSVPTIFRNVRMKSKLEARAAKVLYEYGIKYEYESKKFWLEELQCTYHPDFYLPEFDIHLEIKGRNQGLEKVDALRRLGYTVCIVRIEDLKGLETKLVYKEINGKITLLEKL